MKILIQHLGDVRFEAVTRGHRLVTDQPVDGGGSDTGMTPPELMLASLGTCAGHYAAQYLKGRSLSVTGLSVKVTAETLLRPARLDGFKIEVFAPEVPAEHEAGLLRAVHACLIHNTMMQVPSVETVVHTTVAV
jgi:putative redox protein